VLIFCYRAGGKQIFDSLPFSICTMSRRRVRLAAGPAASPSAPPSSASPAVIPTVAPTTDNPSTGGFSSSQISSLQSMVSSAVAAAVSAVSTGPPNVSNVASGGDRDVELLPLSERAASFVEGRNTAIPGHVSQHSVDRILRGEFVDFSTLLAPASTPVEPSRKRFLVSEENGEMVLSSAAVTKRKVDSWQTWMEAWTVYCQVIFSQQCSRAGELMGYQARILQAAERFKWASVLEYDTMFRQRAARDLSMTWDVVDVDIYSRCFTGQALPVCQSCRKTGHSAATCPTQRGNKGQTCHRYNKGECTFRICRFQHSCSICNGGHPQTACPRGK